MLVSSGHIEYAPLITTLYRCCFSDQWTEAEIGQILKLPTTIGWVTENSFLICSQVLDEMEIISIGVLPEYRCMHLGSALITELLNYAQKQKVKNIFLEVSVLNTAAICLYTKFGFKKTGVRKNYYQTENGPIDALTMAKEI